MTRILIAATPAYGHVAPLLAIATDLKRRGHHVTFISGSAFKVAIERTGAKFVAFTGKADFDAADPTAFPARADAGVGLPRIEFDIRHMFIDPLIEQQRAMEEFLNDAYNDDPDEPVVLVHDTAFLGMWPVLLGAPGIRPRGVIGVGVTPLTMRSVDVAPFGPGPANDGSEAGRIRNRQLNDMLVNEVFVRTQSHLSETLRIAGARAPAPFVSDGFVTIPDRYIQLSIPALEYARSDLPSGVRYAGALPAGNAPFSPPPWWDRVLGAKHVIAVTQGTLANRDFSELVLPALVALADMDVVVVAVTGRADADLGLVPKNAYVADFIPFDSLLPHVDVLVTNGGYGGVQQALGAGVPLVIAGESEDKAKVAALAEHSGAAINLRTSRPTPEALRTAVQSVLSDPAYRDHALILKADYARQDALATVDACIRELAGA